MTHVARTLSVFGLATLLGCSAHRPNDPERPLRDGRPMSDGSPAAAFAEPEPDAEPGSEPWSEDSPRPLETVDAEALFAPTPDWFVATSPPAARHRADYAPPDLLAITYDEDWSEALVDLVHIARGQTRVVVLAHPDEIGDPVFGRWLRRHGAEVFVAPHDTPWVRDYGPLQLVDETGRTAWLDFEYSVDRPDDDALPLLLGKYFDAEVVRYPVTVDGGAVISNGRGLCAMTMVSFDETALAPDDVESVDALLAALGCHALAVVPFLDDEETGHVDVFAQFTAPDTVVVASVSRAIHAGHATMLDRAARILGEAAAAIGQRLTVHRVPMMVDAELFYTYVNGVRLPGGFLVPRYFSVDAELELRAYASLDTALGGLPLFPVDADAMVYRGGALHCLALGLGAPARRSGALAGRTRRSAPVRR